MVGIVKFTNVDGTNRTYQAMKELKNDQCGKWKLVWAYDKVANLTKQRQQHKAAQKTSQQTKKTPFVPCQELVAERAGYIIWKVSKLVIFYTNDLAAMPTRVFIDGDNNEAITCLHGIAMLFQWIGTEKIHHTQFDVPATIVAYNLFMNSVDQLDQKQSTNPTKCKETKL
jgi:hypothetical protein